MDELIFYRTGFQMAERGVTAVESHKCIMQCIREFTVYVLVVHILRNGIINIQKRYWFSCNTGTNIF